MCDAGGQSADRGHLFLLTHLTFQQTELGDIIEAPNVTGRILFVNHDRRNRKSEVDRNVFPMRRRDLETSRIDFRQHAGKDLPDGHLQRFARTVSRDFLGRPIEEVNAPFNIRGDEPGSQAINNAVAVCLEKCNLSGRLLQFHAGPSPALRQEIREKRNRAETENIQADDVLQRWKIGPDIRRRRNITEIAEIQVREMEQRACGSRYERSPPLKQDA